MECALEDRLGPRAGSARTAGVRPLGGGTRLTRRLFVLAPLAGLALATAPTGAASATDPEARVLDLMNTERATRGLPVLAWEPRLGAAAADYAAALADRGVLVHRGAD